MVALLVNENFPRPAIQVLLERGVDVKSIAASRPGIDDESVLALARGERRWLVTFDTDYGELLFKQRLPPPPALLLLREPHYGPAEPAAWLLALLAHPDEVEGFFCVVGRGSLRKRPLLERLDGSPG